MAFGWEPMGTEPPTFVDECGEIDSHYSIPAERWCGTYMTNDYEAVAAEDAAALADALEGASADRAVPEALHAYLPGLIRLCRAGGFVIK